MLRRRDQRQRYEGIERKLQEMRYAIQVEKDFSKNDILLGYLNIANFGGTVYGIEAASKYYFSTSAAKLTVAQAATLAGIVQNPNTYRIDMPQGTTTNEAGEALNTADSGYSLTKDRRHYVLGRMLADGKITQAQYDEADASEITPTLKQPTQGCAAAGVNAYFCQYVRSIVLDDEAFGKTPQDRADLLRRGGLKIYTSLDYNIQNPAAQAMRDIVPANYDNDYFGAAGVSIEVGTGRILSITQNTQFDETTTDDLGKTSLVFAGDQKHGNSGGFQVGSVYKLSRLIDWLEKGHSVNEVLNGRVQTNLKIPVCESPQTANTKEIGNFGGGGRLHRERHGLHATVTEQWLLRDGLEARHLRDQPGCRSDGCHSRQRQEGHRRERPLRRARPEEHLPHRHGERLRHGRERRQVLHPARDRPRGRPRRRGARAPGRIVHRRRDLA